MSSQTSEQGFELVVTAGADLGTRIRVGEVPIVVGRGRGSDLKLSDPSVSRRHLEIASDGDRGSVRVLDGAAPMHFGGKACLTCTLERGQKVVIGSSALTYVAESRASTSASNNEVTRVRALLDDGAVDTRGLGAIFDLSEHLDAPNEEAVAEALGAWARRHIAPTTKIAILHSEDDPEIPVLGEQISVERHARETVIWVPLIGLDKQVMRVSLATSGEQDSLGPELQRLLAVAGRIVASSVAKTRALERSEEQNQGYRQLAVGGARSFLGSTDGAARVEKMLQRVASTSVSALIQGETGTGKSFLARLIHEASDRRSEPFRVINCASIPDHLVESELFGHAPGAFTGAGPGGRKGALEAVGRGTLLLDEIGDMPLASQAKLLRVLEERQFERLGDNDTIKLNARVLTATNRDLKSMATDGTFRSDLFFRISVVTIVVPPLRERSADIAMLAEQFMHDLAPSVGRRVSGISDGALKVMATYEWPGNVRELRNVIEHALVLGETSTIEAGDLPLEVAGIDAAAMSMADDDGVDPDVVHLPLDLGTLEDLAIDAALRATNGSKKQAAALLGINRVTLYKKLKAKEPG